MTLQEFFAQPTNPSLSKERMTLIFIAGQVAQAVKINTPLHERENMLRDALESAGFSVSNYSEEKPHTGAAFRVLEMKDHYRINFRCGYGKHNYAPVLFVKNQSK